LRTFGVRALTEYLDLREFKCQEAGKNCTVRRMRMGRACSMHGRDEKCIQDFGWKAWKEETMKKIYT
jgi:hypothetical protein